jgi:hypothetical protein
MTHRRDGRIQLHYENVIGDLRGVEDVQLTRKKNLLYDFSDRLKTLYNTFLPVEVVYILGTVRSNCYP